MAAPVYPSALLYSTSYYDYLYYTTLLLMYRPVPESDADALSIVSCGDSSVQVIRSYWDSYSVGKLKWIWLTLSQVYFAGITILWCLEQNARSLRESQPPLEPRRTDHASWNSSGCCPLGRIWKASTRGGQVGRDIPISRARRSSSEMAYSATAIRTAAATPPSPPTSTSTTTFALIPPQPSVSFQPHHHPLRFRWLLFSTTTLLVASAVGYPNDSDSSNGGPTVLLVQIGSRRRWHLTIPFERIFSLLRFRALLEIYGVYYLGLRFIFTVNSLRSLSHLDRTVLIK